jgi:multidrug efflux system membrane fusion protein
MSTSATSRRNSILIATGIALAFAAWILSGLGRGLPASEGGESESRTTAMRVTVRNSTAMATTRTIIASARTEPDRAIELKAETEGRVISIGAERGSIVKAGQAIVELDLRDRDARLAEAEALVRQRELEYQAAQRLHDQKFMSEAELAAADALLVSARAARERIALDISHTHVTAPFDAVVNDRVVEIGDYVSVGDTIARLVDADPLIVVANVNERDVGALQVGSLGQARVLGGSEVEGRVRYLAPVADESTRSFRVELAIPNPDFSRRVGTSAELILSAGEITAHELSPALLTLADDGTIGVKTVDNTNRVSFLPVEIVGSSDDGILVTGLPADVTIITIGQGFVADGQAVIPVPEGTELTQAKDERAY